MTQSKHYPEIQKLQNKTLIPINVQQKQRTDEEGVITNYYEYTLIKKPLNFQPTLENIKAVVCEQVNKIRYKKIYQDSISYIFPGDTEADGIQMRDEKDRQNIQDIVIDAMNKDAADVMYFMPKSNNIKTLTAQNIIDIGQFIKSRGDSIVSYAWSLKEQINNAVDTDSLPDVEVGWPG